MSKQRVIGIKPVEIKRPVLAETSESELQLQASMEEKLKLLEDELEELAEKKKRLLEETETEINEAKEAWENEREAYVEAAMKEGYAEGFSRGTEDGLRKYEQLIATANEVIVSARKDYESRIEQSEDMIVELAIASANKILQKTLRETPADFISIVKAAIQEIKDFSSISIYVHPVNFDAVLQQKDELKSLLGAETNLDIFPDSKLQENGCTIEHPYGQIDASVDTQLEQIRNILIELVQEQKP